MAENTSHRHRVLNLLRGEEFPAVLPPEILARCTNDLESFGNFPVSELAEALASVLCEAVERRMRTCLGREFRQVEADLSRVRGHVDILRTERRQLFMQAKVACRFQTLTADTSLNRCVLAALRLLSGLCRGRSVLLCRKYATAMERAGVGGPCPAEPEIRAVAVRQARAKTPDARKDARMLHAARVGLALASLRRDSSPR